MRPDASAASWPKACKATLEHGPRQATNSFSCGITPTAPWTSYVQNMWNSCTSTDYDSYKKFKEVNQNQTLKVVNGKDCYDEILDYETDMVVAAITGSTGLMPVVKAAKKGIPIALANKESLVCSGSLITSIESL